MMNDNVSFSPYLWAESLSSDIRTTNSLKAFHRDFNDQFDISHPNYCFTIINTLIKIQEETFLNIFSFITFFKKRE